MNLESISRQSLRRTVHRFYCKILNQYTPFLARVEGLENIAVVEQEDTKAREQEIRNLILNISM